ncbi:hypothetical protein D9613_004533 [Agrocybe pediades]|uniref:F-box domain-containing protein n=1 Tax=Agrocybe pediades TaxID=84607 RepID=A0A8H4QIK4_9AGAR|nr:hypothetical protein D9613_004533 [Agrocybe pediades]
MAQNGSMNEQGLGQVVGTTFQMRVFDVIFRIRMARLGFLTVFRSPPTIPLGAYSILQGLGAKSYIILALPGTQRCHLSQTYPLDIDSPRLPTSAFYILRNIHLSSSICSVINIDSPMTQTRKKCLECNNCDAIHTSALNDSVSLCPSGTQKCAACITVDKLKSEVEETMERLKELLQDLRQAKMQMNQRHSTIFNKLPAEILYSVFESYVSDRVAPGYRGEAFNRHFRREKMASPTVLSQVCSQWRQVALATPRIWTTVVLMWDVSAEEEIDRVREWISRTRGFPLDIYMATSSASMNRMDDWPCPLDSVNPSFFPLLQAIASTSGQWRNFTAYVPHCVLEYLGQHVKNFGSLEELSIYRVGGLGATPNTVWAECQPAPKSVNLRYCSLDTMNIQWNTVTTMDVIDITIEQFVTLLSSAPGLITCTVDFKLEIGEERSWHVNRPAIKHAKIQNFTTTSSSCSFVFYRLKLPNLRTFTCNWTNLEQTPDAFFQSILDLKILNITYIPRSVKAETLQSALSKVPRTVTHLFLSFDHYSSRGGDDESDPRLEILRIFDQTAAVVNANTVLPSLTSLEIRTDAANFPWKYISKCFGSIVDNTTADQNAPRRRGPLSRFQVTDWRAGDREQVLIPPDVLKELMVLQHNGAEIIFRRENGDDLLARSIVDAGLDNC